MTLVGLFCCRIYLGKWKTGRLSRNLSPQTEILIENTAEGTEHVCVAEFNAITFARDESYNVITV